MWPFSKKNKVHTEPSQITLYEKILLDSSFSAMVSTLMLSSLDRDYVIHLMGKWHDHIQNAYPDIISESVIDYYCANIILSVDGIKENFKTTGTC